MKKKILIAISIGILAIPVVAFAAPFLPIQGGTGTSTKPTFGQLLMGNNNGTYSLVSTSSLGITGGSGASFTTNPFTATYFTATSTVTPSTFPQITGTLADYQYIQSGTPGGQRFGIDSSSGIFDAYNTVSTQTVSITTDGDASFARKLIVGTDAWIGNGTNDSSIRLYDQTTAFGTIATDYTGQFTFNSWGSKYNFIGTLNSSALTASRILASNGSSDIVSLDTATYPSLTELSYVKGVTSNVQTQLNTKLSTTTAASTYVPYTGATSDVNLGLYNLSVNGKTTSSYFTATSTTATSTFAASVGIGTNTPTAKLQVNGNASAITSIFKANATTPGNLTEWQDSSGNIKAMINSSGFMGASGYTIYGSTGAATGKINVASNGVFTSNGDTGISRLAAGVFAVGNATAGNTSGTLIASYVGIGTNSPISPLHVAGNAYVAGTLNVAGIETGELRTGTSEYAGYSIMSADGQTPVTYDRYVYFTYDSGYGTIYLPQAIGEGRLLTIKSFNSVSSTIYPYGSQLIDFVNSSVALDPNSARTFQDIDLDGMGTVGWVTINRYDGY